MQAPKNGFFYVLDRANGEFISGGAYAFMTWANGLDPKTGRPKETKEARYDKSGKPTAVVPGPGGAHSWQPMSYSPLTGLRVFPRDGSGLHVHSRDEAEDQQDRLEHRRGFQRGQPARRSEGAGRHQGAAQGPSRRMGSGGAERSLARAVRSSVEWRHACDGGQPRVRRAIRRARSRRIAPPMDSKLWSAPTQAGVLAPPISYEIDGEQYVAIEVGWGGAFGLAAGELARDAHMASRTFRACWLQDRWQAKLPELPADNAASSCDPPAEIGNEAIWTAGKAVLSHAIAACATAIRRVSGGVIPDLRLSLITRDPSAWEGIVRGGERTPRGMVSFASEVSPDDSENVRAYVIHRAHETQKLEQLRQRPQRRPRTCRPRVPSEGAQSAVVRIAVRCVVGRSHGSRAWSPAAGIAAGGLRRRRPIRPRPRRWSKPVS